MNRVEKVTVERRSVWERHGGSMPRLAEYFQILDCLFGRRELRSLHDVRPRGTVNHEREHVRPAVMAARVHHALAFVDLPKIEIRDDLALALSQRLPTHVFSLGRNDGSKTATGDRA